MNEIVIIVGCGDNIKAVTIKSVSIIYQQKSPMTKCYVNQN